MNRIALLLLLSLNAFEQVSAQKQSTNDKLKSIAEKSVETNGDMYRKTALQIWNYAEVGYKEYHSAALLETQLRENGFQVDSGVAGIPTAFVASYGNDHPIIAILGEYDALPGLSQAGGTPDKSPIANRNAGHGCGHHLFGTASMAAAIAVKELIEQKKISGTIRFYGCPAEEGGSGKVYLVSEGLFKDVDVAIHWHPGDDNRITMKSALANKSAKFRFHGISAHAAASPERGRSAVDGVESMDYMVNMMREHIPQETRIHYVITDGGKAPNVVPDFAEVYYYVRHPSRKEVVEIFDRVTKAAEGAALGTGTNMDYEIIGGTHDLLLNHTLAEAMQRNLAHVGGVQYTEEEKAYAAKIQAGFGYNAPLVSSAATVHPLDEPEPGNSGSTDVGDVSYVVPTVGMSAATWVPGTAAHSWQAVSCGATEIGIKGMVVAAKTMALTAIDLFLQPELVAKARKEFEMARGDYQYAPLLGNRKPALNYRD